MCVQACRIDALGMTEEFECSLYDTRYLLLNKEQLLAISDRNFPVREKRIALQHQKVDQANAIIRKSSTPQCSLRAQSAQCGETQVQRS
jgi:formate hydrogenlyase subunit 6/NADH:ubiquinone oxidoreductase subunit I